MKERKTIWNGKQENRFSKNPRIPAVPQYRLTWSDTAPPGEMEHEIRTKKRRKNTRVFAVARGYVDSFYLLIGLVPCSPVCRPLLSFFNSGFPTPPPPHPPFSFGRHVSGRRGARSFSFPPPRATRGHEPFGCFEDSPVLLSTLLCCKGPQNGFNSKLPWGNLLWNLRCTE